MALWLERRFLTGELSLIQATPDLWLSCNLFVGKVSAVGQPTKPTQPSIPSGSVIEYSDPCNYMVYGGGDH